MAERFRGLGRRIGKIIRLDLSPRTLQSMPTSIGSNNEGDPMVEELLRKKNSRFQR